MKIFRLISITNSNSIKGDRSDLFNRFYLFNLLNLLFKLLKRYRLTGFTFIFKDRNTKIRDI